MKTGIFEFYTITFDWVDQFWIFKRQTHLIFHFESFLLKKNFDYMKNKKVTKM